LFQVLEVKMYGFRSPYVGSSSSLKSRGDLQTSFRTRISKIHAPFGPSAESLTGRYSNPVDQCGGAIGPQIQKAKRPVIC
jgi:hypothetical protein